MNKAMHRRQPLSLRFAALVARMRESVKIRVPVGYQDENGFHFGVKPAEKETNRPPFW